MKDRADKHRRVQIFEPGDQVLVSTKSHPALMGNRKQQDLRVGPFVVKRKINDNAYELEGLPPSVPCTQNVTFLSPFNPNLPCFASRPPIEVAVPEQVDGEMEWEVEAVTDFRQSRRGDRRYKVKWVGAQKEQWLPESEMQHCPQAIRDYFIQHSLPIPAAVSQFCAEAEAADNTSSSEVSPSNHKHGDEQPFLWDTPSEEEE